MFLRNATNISRYVYSLSLQKYKKTFCILEFNTDNLPLQRIYIIFIFLFLIQSDLLFEQTYSPTSNPIQRWAMEMSSSWEQLEHLLVSIQLSTHSTHIKLWINYSYIEWFLSVAVYHSLNLSGTLNGSLSSLKAHELGSAAITGALIRSNVRPEEVSDVIMGQVSFLFVNSRDRFIHWFFT